MANNYYFCIKTRYVVCENQSMNQNTELAVLPFKVLELARIIADRKRMSLSDALFYLYNSDLYHDLLNPDLKLWYNSGAQLYDLLEEEKWDYRQARITPAEAQFFVFCIEQFRMHHRLPSANVLEMFIDFGVEGFLIKNFEVLHSQSVEYILREIDRYIKKRR